MEMMIPPHHQLYQSVLLMESKEEPTFPRNNPSAWTQSLHPEFVTQCLISIDFDTLFDKTASKNVNKLTSSIASTEGLAILSIVSGVKISTILLHNM